MVSCFYFGAKDMRESLRHQSPNIMRFSSGAISQTFKPPLLHFDEVR